MPCRFSSLACLVAGLAHSALGLRSLTGKAARPYRQRMINEFDLQYHSTITLGGQKIQGIVDTGSFELVVFSKSCSTCGVAAAYNEKVSRTFVKGLHQTVHSYGSGSCEAVEGRDDVTLGHLKAPRQDLWLATSCEMPLLEQATFNAIVGVGPPGQPEFTARSGLEQVKEIEKEYRATKREIPKELEEQKATFKEELESAKNKTSMLENFGMKAFSTCFGREPGAPAWMIWNDNAHVGAAGAKRLPVVGNITWSLAVQGLDFAGVGNGGADLPVGCQDGCGAIVDTGTSLMAVPTSVYQAIATTLQNGKWNLDCTDLSTFPDLVVRIGGSKLHLPPSSYIGSMYGEMRAEVAKYMHLDKLGRGAVPCQLLLMDMGEEKTQFGSMMILGMPFFRQYYTTFDLGKGRGDRSIFVSLADQACKPGGQLGTLRGGDRTATTPRHVDVSKLRVPHWLLNRHESHI